MAYVHFFNFFPIVIQTSWKRDLRPEFLVPASPRTPSPKFGNNLLLSLEKSGVKKTRTDVHIYDRAYK